MRHRLRSVVWRELPYSVRRSLVGLLRAIDDFENFWIRVWQSLQYSPAWIFVAIVGSIGIALTILLFFLLTQELLAGASRGPARQPILEPVEIAAASTTEIDSRLCIEDVPLKPQPYPADFGFTGAVMLADYQPRQVSQPPRRRPSRIVSEPVDFEPPRTVPVVREEFDPFDVPLPARAAPMADIGDADLQLDVRHWRQPAGPQYAAGPAQVITAHSEPPAIPRAARPSGLNWDELDRWTWFRERVAPPLKAVAYRGEPTVQMEPVDEAQWDDFSAYPNHADVALQVELYAPQQVSTRQPGRSRLVIRNAGTDTIRRLEIQEPVRPLSLVTRAEPPAALTDGTLYRELLRLRAGREQTVELDWFAQVEGGQTHEARVIAEAWVAASVDVIQPSEPNEVVEPVREPPPRAQPVAEPPRVEEPLPVDPDPPPVIRRPPSRVPSRVPSRAADPPPVREPVVEPRVDVVPPPAEAPPVVATPTPPPPALACRVTGRDRIALNAVAEFDIEVANPGSTPLTDVRIWADLPMNLRHRHGNHLELVVGDLPAGTMHKAVLRVVGERVGSSRARIQAVCAQTRSADTQPVLTVIAAPKSAPTTRPLRLPPCDCRCDYQVTLRMPSF